MLPQKSGEIRRSGRLSEQRQQRQVDKGSSPGKGGYNSPQISSVIDPSAEQGDAALDSFRTPDGPRKKTSTTRPPNAFMLFRSDFWAREKLKVEPIERDHRDISRIAAICWNNLDDETKAVYRKRAKEHRVLHRLQHPEYRYSPLQETTRKGRRRAVKSGSTDDERCKRLAVQVMGEFQKGKWPRNNSRRMVRDIDFQNSLNDTEELVKIAGDVGVSEEVRLGEPNMACGEGSIPTFYSEGKENWMNGPTLIPDAVDMPFGHKPRLEQYIPELQFWYAVVSRQNEAADQLLLDSRNEPESEHRVETWSRTGREGVADLDCEVELDQYFQFDGCDES